MKALQLQLWIGSNFNRQFSTRLYNFCINLEVAHFFWEFSCSCIIVKTSFSYCWSFARWADHALSIHKSCDSPLTFVYGQGERWKLLLWCLCLCWWCLIVTVLLLPSLWTPGWAMTLPAYPSRTPSPNRTTTPPSLAGHWTGLWGMARCPATTSAVLREILTSLQTRPSSC